MAEDSAARSDWPRGRRELPEQPVRLFSDGEDPCVRRLQVLSYDQVGLLFKLCELLQSHGVDVTFAEITTEDGIANNRFELHASRPSDFADATDWCKELEDFLARNCASGGAALEGSLAAVSKRLSVNPDLLSVVSFKEIAVHDGPPHEYRYSLELEGINQAGLLTYTALVLYRSGFSVIRATISTVEGHILDKFELAADSVESERLLRSYLDVPSLRSRKSDVPLPFHCTHSDVDLQAFMYMWGKNAHRTGSPSPRASLASSPRLSREGSFVMEEEDQEGSNASVTMRMSRVPSVGSNCEVPTEQQQDPVRNLLTVAGSSGLASLVNTESSEHPSSGKKVSPASALAAAKSPQAPSTEGHSSATSGTNDSGPGAAWTKRPTRKMSVHFANGDVYTGNCVLFEGGEKRHGLGTYIYSPGTHETYKQYRGQWREDKKHGYGVLFYRNGGVYVGQWENNQKHGLGVLLDHVGESDATAMPSFRYEGQWHEDEMHGLGAEETDTSSYFGHFTHGKRQGQGVKMDLAKMGVKGMKAHYHGGRAVPLLDALEAEMALFTPSRRQSSHSSPVRRDFHDDLATGMHRDGTDEARPSLASYSRPLRVNKHGKPEVTGNSESGSSGKTSGDTRTPLSARMQNLPSRGDFQVTPSENQETPMLGPGNRGMKQRFDSRATPMSLQSFPSRGDTMTPLNFERHKMPLHSGGRGGGGASSSSAAPARPQPGSASPKKTSAGSADGPAVGGSIVFSLSEENNLLSPHETTLNKAISEADAAPVDLSMEVALEDSLSGATVATVDERARGRSPTEGTSTVETSTPGKASGSSRSLRQSHSEPRPPKSPAEEKANPVAAADESQTTSPTNPFRALSQPEVPTSPSDVVGTTSAPQVVAASGSEGQHGNVHGGDPRRSRMLSSKRDARPVRTPLLWSEDELAAFFACLGISPEVCAQVQQKKIKGIVHLLEMSNSELRREFGLQTPVERLVVRQSLKRLLDADRWENSVRGHKVGDILSDSVLGRFMVPLEELMLVTKISQGGFGTVYRGVLEPSVERGGLRAHRPHLVAVKEMKGEARVRLYELLKEACVMASLNHPNICTFIGVCADARARKHYIISELMDCSLFDLIHQPYKLRWHGELTVSLVISLSKGICAGIVYIHQAHLVHADLKSSNILIDYSSSWQLVPRICDFGHAAVRTFPTPHHRCGTPHWAGPEVLRSEALGPKADIYSFGVIMWEMLAQKLPHKGLSFGQVLASVGWAGWTPDMSLLPEVPQELRRLLRECLSFTPAERPRAKDVQRRLRWIPKQAKHKALKMLVGFMG